MKIKHDPQTGDVMIRLNERQSVKNQRITAHCILDLDAEGNVIGIELLNVHQYDIDPKNIEYIDVTDPVYKEELMKKVAARKQEAHGQ